MSADPGDELWSAIADPSRRRVLDLLVRGGEASASSLASEVPFTRQAVAKHLAILESAGLVTRHKEGREVLFRVDTHRLDDAARAMTQIGNDWGRRLQAIRRLAEASHREATRRGAPAP